MDRKQEDRLTEYHPSDISGVMADMNNQICKAFRQSDLSMKALADEADVHYSIVHGLITGTRDIKLSTVEKLCGVLGLELTKKRRRSSGKSN